MVVAEQTKHIDDVYKVKEKLNAFNFRATFLSFYFNNIANNSSNKTSFAVIFTTRKIHLRLLSRIVVNKFSWAHVIYAFLEYVSRSYRRPLATILLEKISFTCAVEVFCRSPNRSKAARFKSIGTVDKRMHEILLRKYAGYLCRLYAQQHT